MKAKAYYYTAVVSTPNEPYKYFKALSKKQVKQHLKNTYTDFDIICDPSNKPVHGIYYQDITEVFYEKQNDKHSINE
jgi:hypothetical protein